MTSINQIAKQSTFTTNIHHSNRTFSTTKMGLFGSSKDSVATQPGAGMPQQAMDRGFSSASSISSDYSGPVKQHSPTFPRVWHAFVNKYNIKSMAMKLGESKDTPIYSVSMPWGYYGKMHLHNGPDYNRDPVIATARHTGMFYNSAISLPGGINTDLKCSFGTSKYDFECPVGPNGEVEKFQWKGGKATLSGKWTLIRLATGEELARYDEGKAGWSLPSAFTFYFTDQALDGSLGPVFPVMAAFTGMRCWQSTKNIRYTTGTAAGSSVAAAGA